MTNATGSHKRSGVTGGTSIASGPRFRPRAKPFTNETDGFFRPPVPGPSNGFIRLRDKLWPGQLIADILSKPWMETAVPAIALTIVITALSLNMDGFLSSGNISGILRQAGEMGFVVLGMTLVVMVGGIDLSVGSIFALSNFVALLFVQLLGWPAPLAVAGTMIVGGALGAFNGILIGYLRLRAFLTTLISLTIFRAIYDILILNFGNQITDIFPDDVIWNYIAFANIFGFGFSVWLCLGFAIACHILLTRLRPGWHILAIGGARRAAHNAGVPVARVVMACYIASGALTALSAVFFAARLGTLSGDVGSGLEFTILTAVVVGGISLGGGRGSVTKAILGLLIVLFIVNGLMSMSATGGVINIALASVLILASVFDIAWTRNRAHLAVGITLRPAYRATKPYPVVRANTGNVWEVNDRLSSAEIIDADHINGPDDVILDDSDTLYVTSRQGDIMYCAAPEYQTSEIYAHTGGHTLGLAFDTEGRMIAASAGYGICQIGLDRNVELLTVETNRTRGSVVDDRRLKFAGDVVVAPDGLVFFSESSSRFDVSDAVLDIVEARGTGRIICYNPAFGTTHTLLSGLAHPNGIALGNDGMSLIFSESAACTVIQFWFSGPKKGQTQTILSDLPGYPDNINPASDGSYWLAIAGMRSPVLDLALARPGFRKRMAEQLPLDEWLIPQMNRGCVVRFTADGQVLETLWDAGGQVLPTINSMREHKGWLYLVSSAAGRVARIRLPQYQSDKAFSQFSKQGTS